MTPPKDRNELVEVMARASRDAEQRYLRDANHTGVFDRSALQVAMMSAALAALEAAGVALVPVAHPSPKEYIAQGTRTVNRKASTVFLGWSDEGGGWHQWGAGRGAAKRFKTEADAFAAARSCPGPYFHQPDLSTISVEAVDTRDAARHRAQVAASPYAPEAHNDD